MIWEVLCTVSYTGSARIPYANQERGEISMSLLVIPDPGQPALACCGQRWVRLSDKEEFLSSKFAKLTPHRASSPRWCEETHWN